jgi:alkylhydroperoxidase/carboxymuconolactone decarboxylase family protein YurZ
VLSVREGADAPGLSEAESTVIRAVDELFRDDQVSRTTMEALRQHLANDGEVVEIVYVMAIWRAITQLMASFECPLEPGYSQWAPDGVRPD